MLTIYDFNPTKKELKLYVGHLTKEEYLSIFARTKESAYEDIVNLLHRRGDQRYKIYYDQLPEGKKTQMRFIWEHP